MGFAYGSQKEEASRRLVRPAYGQRQLRTYVATDKERTI